MSAALDTAGPSASATERLHAYARQAIEASPNNWDGAKDAFYALVRHDAPVLWEMFNAERARVAQKLLATAAEQVRERERFGQPVPRLADPVPARAAAPGSSAQRSAVRAVPAASPRIAMQAVSAVTRLSILDTFKADGRPIGDLTPREANEWRGRRVRDIRFVGLLTQNLPVDEPIRKYRTAEAAAEIMQRAEQPLEAAR